MDHTSSNAVLLLQFRQSQPLHTPVMIAQLHSAGLSCAQPFRKLVLRPATHPFLYTRKTSPCRPPKASPAINFTSIMELGVLSQEQIAKFHEQGYLVLPGFASLEQCQQLKTQISSLLTEFDPQTVKKTIFSTKKQVANDYFYNSASNVSYFFEEKAFDEEGNLRQAKELSINKIGHALHDLDPVFRSFSRSQPVINVMRSLGYQRPLPVQSMYIFKQPNIGGEVQPHQDSTYLYTEPLSCTGLWWALEDATKENGCLWAQPGIHKQGLQRRFLRKGDEMVYDNKVEQDLTQFVPLECPAGTLVLLQGENVHYSCENTSPVSRHSYSMHIIESAPGTVWAADNWAQRSPDMPWEPLYDDVHAKQEA